MLEFDENSDNRDYPHIKGDHIMKRILRIEMDVYSINYTLCLVEPRFDRDNIVYANVKVTSDSDNIVQFIQN